MQCASAGLIVTGALGLVVIALAEVPLDLAPASRSIKGGVEPDDEDAEGVA